MAARGEIGRGAKDGRSGWSEATAVYYISLLKQITFRQQQIAYLYSR